MLLLRNLKKKSGSILIIIIAIVVVSFSRMPTIYNLGILIEKVGVQQSLDRAANIEKRVVMVVAFLLSKQKKKMFMGSHRKFKSIVSSFKLSRA
jgi:hypothetical protein